MRQRSVGMVLSWHGAAVQARAGVSDFAMFYC
jgi:hypothetical protein